MIHQIFISDNTDPDQENQLARNKSMFESFYPELEYRLWREKDIQSFLRQFYPNLIGPYNQLQAYAAKADLARLVIVNHFGGWYFDFYTEPVFKINTSDKSMVFFRDRQEHTGTSFAVANGLFYSTPNNPVLVTAVQLILSNIDNKYYGGNPLCSSATVPFGRAIAIHGYNENHYIGDHKEIDGKKYFIIEGGIIFSNGKTIDGGKIALSGTNNYNDIWNQGNYYGELN